MLIFRFLTSCRKTRPAEAEEAALVRSCLRVLEAMVFLRRKGEQVSARTPTPGQATRFSEQKKHSMPSWSLLAGCFGHPVISIRTYSWKAQRLSCSGPSLVSILAHTVCKSTSCTAEGLKLLHFSYVFLRVAGYKIHASTPASMAHSGHNPWLGIR